MISRALVTISVFALLALPAVAMAQDRLDAGWADTPPTVNGSMGATEWANASRVQLYGSALGEGFSLAELDRLGLLPQAAIEGEVSPSQTIGWLYVMNDARNLYVAATLDMGTPAGWPVSALTTWGLVFEDEPIIGDDRWAADLCADNPDEGVLGTSHSHGPGLPPLDADVFLPYAEQPFPWVPCASLLDPPGYDPALGYGPTTVEMKIDLSNSALQAAPGSCVNLGLQVMDSEQHGEQTFVGVAYWPAALQSSTGPADLPDILAEVCLAEEPVVEEFVPEPGTMALLGTGLAGLGGYATLRWRSRDKG